MMLTWMSRCLVVFSNAVFVIVNDKTRSCGVGMSRESKFLSLVLRHKPEEIGLQLDKHGWVRVDELLRKLKKANRKLGSVDNQDSHPV